MSRYFVDKSYYFVTVPTNKRYHFFNSNTKKKIILDQINRVCNAYNLKEFNFGIISNHYHFVAYFKEGSIMPKILKQINGRSSYELNKLTDNKKEVWGEYYIYLIEDDVLLAKALGYVVGNPLKHKEIKSFKELEKYPFSSYKSLIKRMDKKDVNQYIRSVINIRENDFTASNFKVRCE
ncbi:MAG: transposase [Patescibacteria group bacterium]|nr:transposase [Patescibacteria group bacterium]MDZ7798331.1 transposase [Patescibacteria group bacterium]